MPYNRIEWSSLLFVQLLPNWIFNSIFFFFRGSKRKTTTVDANHKHRGQWNFICSFHVHFNNGDSQQITMNELTQTKDDFRENILLFWIRKIIIFIDGNEQRIRWTTLQIKQWPHDWWWSFWSRFIMLFVAILLSRFIKKKTFGNCDLFETED